MAEPSMYLQRRYQDEWLIGYESRSFDDWVEHQLEVLTQVMASEATPRILLAEPDPLRFLAGFLAACVAGCSVFLGSSRWSKAEWKQAIEIVRPHQVWGACPLTSLPDPHRLPPLLLSAPLQRGEAKIMIPTGGSSGQMRFAIHTWDTLMASVEGFRTYFQLEQVNSLCTLPLHHVSGLMQFMRSFNSGGQLALASLKDLQANQYPDLDPSQFFISLVPTQLQRLLTSPTSATWLSQFQTVLLGGASPWPDLLNQARQLGIRLAPTYGMTETASQIVTLKPDEFLNGNNSCGQILPHACVSIQSEAGVRRRKVWSAAQPPYAIGTISIQAGSLALGYYPCRSFHPTLSRLKTDDLGYLDSQGYLHIVGRSSHKIITGGENVFPVEVEAAIRATGMVADVCVMGHPDPDWGEVVIAVYVPGDAPMQLSTLQATLEQNLSKFKCPKRWIPVDQLPRNAQGKINYETVRQWVSQQVSRV